MSSYGSLQEVKDLCKTANIYFQDSLGYNALIKATVASNTEVVRFLLSPECCLANKKNPTRFYRDIDHFSQGSRMNAFLTAVYLNNLEILKILVEGRANPHVAHHLHRLTPLKYAVNNSNHQMLKYLLDLGIDPKMDTEKSIIYTTIWKKDLQSLEILLTKISDDDLQHLCMRDEREEFAMSVDQSKMKIVNSISKYSCKKEKNCFDGNSQTLSNLIRSESASLEVEHNLLQISCSKGFIYTLKFLIEMGADPHFIDLQTRSLPQFPAMTGQFKILMYLHSLGVNIHGFPKNGIGIFHSWTPLHYAVLDGNSRMIRFLLIKGADPLSNVNDLPYSGSVIYEISKVIVQRLEILLENFHRINILMIAMIHDDPLFLIKTILRYSNSELEWKKLIEKSISAAVKLNLFHLVSFILDYKSSTYKRPMFYSVSEALKIAILDENTEMVNILITSPFCQYLDLRDNLAKSLPIKKKSLSNVLYTVWKKTLRPKEKSTISSFELDHQKVLSVIKTFSHTKYSKILSLFVSSCLETFPSDFISLIEANPDQLQRCRFDMLSVQTAIEKFFDS